ncbi:phosphodiesterase [Geobacillus subterraneus]|uniref:Phosphodiesterase n=2 Tax=Geobacillus TaxID=129337 RepID=A0ABM6AAR0_9BACL|nr:MULTISPECIES: alkaline phosphatase family protein [Geobacillus]AMX83378.1 phosphodiesterase [Geobacillus subterraneus]KZS24619.1 phosphodiesterase [Geobacillus subterraneus]OXB90402.1 phosphodiesterase [Geobacillus uzenensis]
MPKRVILLIIDSLMYPALEKAVSEGVAPAFQFFMEKGAVYPNVVTAFPTMSVTVDSSLLTGTYADIHRVPGLVWFHDEEKRLINYGSHVRELWKLGLLRALDDVVYRLNNEHLSQSIATIHEELAAKGKESASINALLYRGNTDHPLRLPALLTLFKPFRSCRKTKGTCLFTYGSFARLGPSNQNGHFWQKYGFNNRFSAQELVHLIRADRLPPFTIVYFPDMDKIVHKHGPMDTKGIAQTDKQLQAILHCYPSWEEALYDKCWIIMGDNGQAPIRADRKKALIDLRQLLRSYKIMALKCGVKEDDEIVLAVNERMAFIYTLNLHRVSLAKLAETLRQDGRIDVIAWLEKDAAHVISGVRSGKLTFRPNGVQTDEYGQRWDVQGDLGVLDLTASGGRISYGDYPDALARLYSSLTSHRGTFLIVSAAPGFEFIGEGSPTHVGGASHGALHRHDSLVPMIVARTDSAPKHLRVIDLKEWMLSLLEGETMQEIRESDV